MVNHRKFPYTSYPSGWFQVAWTDELTIEPRPVHYFGMDLVLYRSESGQAHMFNAICPHMGAHLGFGGTVVGEGIQCPYHGWQFDGDGKNSNIPYADRPNRTKLRKWQVVEVGTMVLAWYDQDAKAPWFEPFVIPEFNDPENYLVPVETRRNYEKVFLKPQFIADNLVDAAHQKFVHRAADIPDIDSFEADGGAFTVDYTMIFGKSKKATWLTPDGKPIAAGLRIEASGIGCTVARFEIDKSVHVQSTTPIDHEYCDSRHTVLVPMKDVEDGRPSEKAIKRFQHECIQFERDLLIWEHQEYVHPVPYPQLERDRFRSFRNWCAQFYADAEPGQFGKYRTDTMHDVNRLVSVPSESA